MSLSKRVFQSKCSHFIPTETSENLNFESCHKKIWDNWAILLIVPKEYNFLNFKTGICFYYLDCTILDVYVPSNLLKHYNSSQSMKFHEVLFRIHC